MFGRVSKVSIRGIKTVTPQQKVNNLELNSNNFDEKKIKRQIKMTGVQERHVAFEGMTSEMLCTQAADELLQHLGWDRNSIRTILYVTETPNFILPSTAFYIQKNLGIGTDCVVYDINLGCSGWIVGMQSVASILSTIESSDIPTRGLLLTGSISSSHVSKEDEAMAMLFGDAGTATAIEISEEASDMKYMQKSDGRGYHNIFMKNCTDHVSMDGTAVFQFTLDNVVESIKEFTEYFCIVESDIDFYIFHQAQKFIIDNMIDLLEIQKEKVLFSYDRYGNTSAAAIPLTLCLHNERLKEKQKVNLVVAGFGVGLSWGALQLQIDTRDILDISDYVSEENE